jgi:hypothetical protein
MEPMHKRILITMIIVIVLVAGFFMITNAITKYTGFSVTEKSLGSDFEICLNNQDITLYINTNDPAQKIHGMELSDYMNDVKIVNCFGNNNACLTNGVDSFPTWIVNQNKIPNDISISQLAEYSGCRLIK